VADCTVEPPACRRQGPISWPSIEAALGLGT
jgi:hypothetical protein